MNSEMQPPPPDDAWLEKMLRDQSSGYLDDAGFTAQVVNALPPRRRTPHLVRRPLLLLGATVIGCGVAAWFGSAAFGEFFVRQFDQIAEFSALAPSWPNYALLGATAVLAVLSTWRVWVQHRQEMMLRLVKWIAADFAIVLVVLLVGCANLNSDPPPSQSTVAPIEARDISGMYVCEQPSLLVIYTFIHDGWGLASIDTNFDRTRPPPAPLREPASPEEAQVVTLSPTITFTWTLTPPNLLTIELPWPEEQPRQHFLRVERLENGKLSLIEMETPTGPDVGLVFRFEHGDILQPEP